MDGKSVSSERKTQFRMPYSLKGHRNVILWTPEPGHASLEDFAKFLMSQVLPEVKYSDTAGMGRVLSDNDITVFKSPDVDYGPAEPDPGDK